MQSNRKTLTGYRISIVPLEEEHLAFRVAYLNDPIVNESMSISVPISLASTRKWFFERVLDSSRRDFAVQQNEADVVVGFCGITSIDLRNQKAEIYMMIGDRRVWGQGYGRDGYKLLTNYAFIELGLNKLYAFQTVGNEKSIRAKHKLGWTQDGILRQDLILRGEIFDRFLFSLLKKDWLQNPVYDDV